MVEQWKKEAKALADSVTLSLAPSIIDRVVLRGAFQVVADFVQEFRMHLGPIIDMAPLEIEIEDGLISIKGEQRHVGVTITNDASSGTPLIEVARFAPGISEVYAFRTDGHRCDLNDPHDCLAHVIRRDRLRQDGDLLSFVHSAIETVFCN